jgi:peptidoglycan/LPS O-acetylase OafA/YrhL
MTAFSRAGGRVRLNALTSLRFVAAAMIVLHHLRGLFGVPQNVGDPFVLDHGVAFFFVLSGFVLTYSYPSLEHVGTPRFLRARIARIWPAHLASLALLFLVFPHDLRSAVPQYSIKQLVANVTLIHGWIPLLRYYFSFNAVSWSISTEFGFYLCFPLLIRNWRRTWASKLAAGFLLLVAMIAMGNAWPEMEASLTYVNPLGRLFEFILGMTAALWWQMIGSRVRLTRAVGTLIELSTIALVVMCMYYSAPTAVWAQPWIGSAGTAWLVHGGVTCVPFALLIVVMAFEAGFIAKALTGFVPVLLGEISYSVYLLHQLLTRFYWQYPRAFSAVPNWAGLAVFVILLLLMAHLMWRLIERPLRRLLQASPTEAPRSAASSTEKEGVLSWRGIAAESAALVVVGLLVGYVAVIRPSIMIVDSRHVERVERESASELRGVVFGGRLALRGAEISRTSEETVLELAWESLASQHLRSRVLVHILDDRGKILSQADYDQDTAHSEVSPGMLWCDHIALASAALRDAKTIAIGFYGADSNALIADRGPRDWDDHRLLVPLASAPAAVSSGFRR